MPISNCGKTRRQPASQRSWFARHSGVVLLGVNAAIFLIVMLVAELVLRMSVSYNPAYYTAVEGANKELVYPYGVIPLNSAGYPDEEFTLDDRRRVGYFGDSVTYGVGAGYGYRISELLEDWYPTYEHLNFGGVAQALPMEKVEEIARLAREYSLDHVIYLFNMNDILPDNKDSQSKLLTLPFIKKLTIKKLDWLRGKSYVYTWLRTTIRNFLAARGIGYGGYQAYEFFPTQHTKVIADTAKRILALNNLLQSQGIQFSVVILPYEMQISEEAARKYSELGISWEDGFIARRTQQLLCKHLQGVRIFDAYWAFVDVVDVKGSRSANGIGEFFVYNKGDKIDWNHPNRAGHRRIAEYLIQKQNLDSIPNVPRFSPKSSALDGTPSRTPIQCG